MFCPFLSRPKSDFCSVYLQFLFFLLLLLSVNNEKEFRVCSFARYSFFGGAMLANCEFSLNIYTQIQMDFFAAATFLLYILQKSILFCLWAKFWQFDCKIYCSKLIAKLIWTFECHIGRYLRDSRCFHVCVCVQSAVVQHSDC